MFLVNIIQGFPGGSVVKNPPANAGDSGLIPGLGKSPGGGSGNSLQYTCLGKHMDRGGWWTRVHGVTKSRTAATAAKSVQSCPTVQPHRWQPTRLLCPWDSPGKNTGLGCHFLLQCIKVKSEK